MYLFLFQVVSKLYIWSNNIITYECLHMWKYQLNKCWRCHALPVCSCICLVNVTHFCQLFCSNECNMSLKKIRVKLCLRRWWIIWLFSSIVEYHNWLKLYLETLILINQPAMASEKWTYLFWVAYFLSIQYHSLSDNEIGLKSRTD